MALRLADGSHVWVQTTRQAAEELELEPGQIVAVRVNGGSRLPDRVRDVTCRGSLPSARSASVTCSSTSRRLARSAIHTSPSMAAGPS